jgi:predicted nucleic acid-binding protein
MNPVFIDTNILVYAYDADAGDKHLKARAILRDCWEAGTGALSMQVLQEFYVTVTGKLTRPLPKSIAREVIQTYEAWPVYRPNLEDLITASELQEQHSFSFWDALIVTTAQKSSAITLFSEDLQDGRQIGSVKIVNPFLH